MAEIKEKKGFVTFSFFLSLSLLLFFFGVLSIETNDEEVAVGVAQLAAFQVVLIFTAVAAILALTCRLRVFSSHEPTRLKVYLTV